MKRFFNQLTVIKRFNVITITAAAVVIMSSFLVWYTSTIFEKHQETVQQLSDWETRLVRIRNDYNGIKADLLTILLSDFRTQKNIMIESEEILNERVAEVREEMSQSDTTLLSDEILPLVNNYYSNMNKYVSYCNAIVVRINAGLDNDSTDVFTARKPIVDVLQAHYSPLRASAIIAIGAIKKYREEQKQQIVKDQNITVVIFVSICVALLILLVALLKHFSTSMLQSIGQAQRTLEEMSFGKLPLIHVGEGRDELSTMLRSMETLIKQMQYTVDFAGNVAKNNFDVEANMFAGNGPVAVALVNMRDNLKIAKVTERQRNWTSVGLAKLSEIIRNQNEDRGKTAFEIVKFLTHYMNAQQAGLFVVHKEANKDKISLQLEACYAFERKKFIEKVIRPGEGLVGQAYLEGEPIVLTEVPQEYVRITSGLGTASPSCVVVSPMKYDSQVEAVFEVASFKIFEKYELDFLEKAGEVIASGIVISKNAIKMQHLLADAQTQTEQLRAAEEEMRQNMEELSATQEQLQRREQEQIREIQRLKKETKAYRSQGQESSLLDTVGCAT